MASPVASLSNSVAEPVDLHLSRQVRPSTLMRDGTINRQSKVRIHIMRYRISGPEVIHERMDDEVVVIHLETGAYYSLNRSGSDFWTVLATGASVDEAVSLLNARYCASRDNLRDAMQGLIARLLEEKLLVADSSMQPGQPAPDMEALVMPEGLPFVRPMLQRYTDMQALLLQDPIHEVDATGWPAPKTAGTPD